MPHQNDHLDFRPVENQLEVAVVSGVGAGHYPLCRGLVAPGLLHAAVDGEHHAPPSAERFKEAILAPEATFVLLIVLNYPADVKNASHGANLAHAAGRAIGRSLEVEVLVVRDDISRRRCGLPGITLVDKIAGGLSLDGHVLEKVREGARTAGESVYSVTARREYCQPKYTIEIGAGMHNQEAEENSKLFSLEQAVNKAAEVLYRAERKPGRYAALFNCFGGVSSEEQRELFGYFVAAECLDFVDWVMGPVTVAKIGDMIGFSVSVIQITEENRDALLGNVELDIWPGFRPLER